MKVYTHFNLDLDAVASLWAAQEFIPGARDAEVVFVPANWDGAEMEPGDLALDIRAGGRGIKGEDYDVNGVGSCFHLIMARADAEAQLVLGPLDVYVETQDTSSNAVHRIGVGAEKSALDLLALVSLNSVLRALQATHPRDDALVASRMAEIFSGMLENGRSRRRAELEANDAELVGNGQVAIVRDKKEIATNAVLFERGVRAVIYVDGDNLGVVREGSETLRIDHTHIVSVIYAAGERIGDGNGDWFAHPAGFMLAWGTRKAPANRPSRVRPEDLAKALCEIYALTTGECWNCDAPLNGNEHCRHCGAGQFRERVAAGTAARGRRGLTHALWRATRPQPGSVAPHRPRSGERLPIGDSDCWSARADRPEVNLHVRVGAAVDVGLVADLEGVDVCRGRPVWAARAHCAASAGVSVMRLRR